MASKKQLENCKNKEWPGVKEDENYTKVVKPELLIMELGRLVPYLEGEYVRFSPINMPKIQIGFTHIIGLVLYVSRNLKEYQLTVDDGTGILNVKHSLKHFHTMQKKSQGKNQVSKDSQKDFVIGDYLHLHGYLSLINYNKAYKNCEDEIPSNRLLYGEPVFYAVEVEVITEEQYYKKMYIWLKAAKNRYTS